MIARADLWSRQKYSLEPRSFVKTVWRAVDDFEETHDNKVRLDIDKLIQIMQDTLFDIHLVTKKFPW